MIAAISYNMYSYFHLLIRMLFPDRDAPGDDLIVRVMRMIDHRDGLEITEETRGMVMVRLDTRRQLETAIIRCGEMDMA